MSTPIRSRTWLEETPARALTFLRGVATSEPIRIALAEAGYTPEDHAEGWRLLLEVAGYRRAMEAREPAENPVLAALAALEGWGSELRRLRAAVHRLQPGEEPSLFENVAPSKGAEAVVATKLFLDRVAELDPASPLAQTLERRGLTAAERTRLGGLVDVALSAPPVPPPSTEAPPDARTEDLLRLRAWLTDWAETARCVLTRRDHLIRIGVAKRRTNGKDEPVTPVPAPVTPAPVPLMGGAPIGLLGPAAAA